MVFNECCDKWDKHGFQLTASIEITKEILDMVNQQSEVCYLIWAINAAKQSNKSPFMLSHTVMDQVRKFSPLLLNHKGFKKYSGVDEVEKRAVRHYKTDPLERFINRQTKIRKVLEDYINKTLSEGRND